MALGQPVRDRRAERHEATRKEILDAAWGIARAQGVAGLSLRDLAAAVGMRPPSLYSYFESKNAIYDAMFRQGYEEFGAREALLSANPGPAALKARVRAMVEFCAKDPARYQLMFQRTLPDFTPSVESYAPAVAVLERLRETLAANGITNAADVDLFTALLSGLSDQQIANDPGGDRWVRLVDGAVDMFLMYVTRAATKGPTS
jgi:AcrR family transcriptional regulator